MMQLLFLLTAVLAFDLRGAEEKDEKVQMGGSDKLMSACKGGFGTMSLPATIGDGTYSLVQSGDSYHVQEGDHGIVTGRFDSPAKGWANVYMGFKSKVDDPSLSDEKKMYAAGFIEGAATAPSIAAFYSNTAVDNRAELGKVFASQLGFVGEHADAEGEDKEEDARWRLSVSQSCQMLGMTDGYNAAREKIPASFLQNGDGMAPVLVVTDIMRLNADGQVDEIAQHLNDGEVLNDAAQWKFRKAFNNIPQGSLMDGSLMETKSKILLDKKRRTSEMEWKKPGRCSAFVKFTGTDVLLGHTTWEEFKEETRSMKRYNFPLEASNAKKVVFSSYPGCISSTDDFALTDTGIAITETTTNVENQNIHNYLRESHIPDYLHVMNTLRLATSGKDFVERFVTPSAPKSSFLQNGAITKNDEYKDLSGMYNSEWMILDYNKADAIKNGKLPEGTLYVMETAPGVSHQERSLLQSNFDDTEDQDAGLSVSSYMTNHGSCFMTDATKKLNNGDQMWASYNMPELKPTIKVMGTENDDDARRGLFGFHGPAVTNMDQMAWLMRRNEPAADCGVGPGKAIAPRADLESWPHAFGGTDTKLLGKELAKSMSLLAISGPTAVVNGKCTPYTFPTKLAGIEQTMDAPWVKVGFTDSEPWTGADGQARDACFRNPNPSAASMKC